MIEKDNKLKQFHYLGNLISFYCFKYERFFNILNSLCTGLEWDPDGETLAIVQDTTGVMFQYDTTTKKTTTIESGLKGITFCRWAKSGDVVIQLYLFILFLFSFFSWQ